jgi:hypothetical protein
MTAALTFLCAAVLTGCAVLSSASGDESSASVPLPSPTGTWSPAPEDAAEGPVAAAPVPTQTTTIDQPVEFETGIVVALTSVSSATVTAETPGEISGPAVVVKLAVTNNSTAPIDLASAVVNLSAADGEYGVGTTAGGPEPLVGTLAPGEESTGIYVFMLDPAQGRDVIISVNYGAGEPLAVFTGKSS